MASSEKRCLYEVLELKMECTTEEIRSAYKKLALQRHPDKLIKSGLSETEATAKFQELSHAYEVLSDPKERAFYDSHRSQILFSNPNSVPDSVIPNLFSYFSNTVYNGYANTNKGFYSVYYDVFNKIYLNEISYCKKLGLGFDLVREAPIMGDLESLYSQVTAFYSYWLGFSTVMDFCWVDQYDVMAGVNRKSRRVMEEENKKVRKKARREYNETVRDLAEFVKKRDKRVIDMAVKRKEEEERRKEEERERKRKAERERMERVREYEEPEWARVEEEEIVEDDEEEEREGKELYCVVCSKKFKSEKQWKNHEQSKKHREKVAELRESFVDEDEDREDDFKEFGNEKEEEELGEDNVEELGERFKEGLGVEEEEDENGVGGLSGSGDEEEDWFFDVKGGGDGGEDLDEEMSVLEAMVSGHNSRRKNVGSRLEDEDLTREVRVENESEEEVMEYNNRKSTGRNRGGKKERGRKNGGGDMKGDVADEDLTREVRVENESEEEVMESNNRKSTRRNRRGKKNGGGDMKGEVDETKGGQSKENNGQDDSNMEDSSFAENESNGKRDDDQLGKSHNSSNQAVDKRGNAKKDTKSKSSSKGKKAKATSKNSSNMCDTCGEEFQSRNKLHMHLGDTGHASLKFL